MEAAPRAVAEDVLLLVGNPNVGKSALFGHLTGKYVIVSNYPGTTVDVTRGRFRRGGPQLEVIDTPGVYSLQPQSEDELVTRDILLKHPGAKVVLVLDAKNLARGLILTQQLCELAIPFCIALNMMDEARSLGARIDISELSRAIGVPVIPTVATGGRGVRNLIAAIDRAGPGRFTCQFPPEIEDPVRQISTVLSKATRQPVSRLLALSLLVEPRSLPADLQSTLDPRDLQTIGKIAAGIRRTCQVPLQAVISRSRMGSVGKLLRRVLNQPDRSVGGLAGWLGSKALDPFWGVVIAGFCLWIVYLLVGVFGAGYLVDWIESGLFDRAINPLATSLAERWIAWSFLRDLLVGPFGLITMALTYSFGIILPVVGTFFVAFGLLEDSGYMPRLAVMANNLMRRMGLHGKAVLPMILGLGCDTMATLTARIMETRKERVLVTLLLALAVPCSAQLGVILGMLGAISWWGVLIWLGVVGMVLFATGAIASRVLPGARSDFILELPPLRLPGLKNILVKTFARIEWYLREAVPLFVLGTLVLFTLDQLQLLEQIRQAAAPVVGHLLGLPPEATDAFLIGFVRRDYGAAGLFDIQRAGLMDGRQIVVSLVIITLYVPCIANFFVMIKERGLKTALAIGAVVMVIATVVGSSLNQLMILLGANP